MSEEKVDPEKLPPPKIRLKANVKSGEFKKSVKVDVKIFNDTAEGIAQVTFHAGLEGSGSWEPRAYKLDKPLEPYSSAEMTVDVEWLKGGESIMLHAFDASQAEAGPRGKYLESVKVMICLRHFGLIQYLEVEYPVDGKFEFAGSGVHEEGKSSSSKIPPFNIALMGPAGAGKTSFLQTIATMLSTRKSVIQNMAQIGGDADHITRQISDYNPRHKYEHIVVWDTYGLVKDTWQDPNVTKLFLQGGLPRKWHMNDKLTPQIQKQIMRKQKKKQHLRRIHCVIFLIPHGSLEVPEEIRQIQGMLQSIQEEGLNALVLLSRVDELSPAIRKNPMKSDEKVQAEITKCHEKFGVPMARIFPCVSYTGERERVWSIDNHTLQILEQALSDCRDFKEFGQGHVGTIGQEERLVFDDSDDDESEPDPEPDPTDGPTPLPTLEDLFDQLGMGHLLERVRAIGVESTEDLNFIKSEELEGATEIQKRRLKQWIEKNF